MATQAIVRHHAVTLVIESAGKQRKITIFKPISTVGRAQDCDVAIADFRVSRLHATLLNEGGEYYIEDAGSRHGTFVNGTRCQRTQLKNNDEITFGVPALKIKFLEGAQANSAANLLLSGLGLDSEGSELGKLRLFLEAARRLSSGLVVNDVLRNMLDYALRLTKAERGMVYLKDRANRAVLACGLDSAGHQVIADANVSHSVVQEAMSSAAEFITADATQQSSLAARESIMANELRTVIAIPLRIRRGAAGPLTAEDVNGVIYLDSRAVSRNLSGVSHDVLRALASECTAVLESARLVEAEQGAQQYQQEMEIAASIQYSLTSVPEVQCDFARVTGSSIPCREVGGDFFDVLVSSDAITVIVVDVSGKGISAALLASVIHGMFYAQISSGASLVETIASVNRFMCSRVAGQKYATLLAVQLRRSGELGIVNCGHVPAMMEEKGAVTRVNDGDLPVGLIADACFHVIKRQLQVGSRLCILTDGISEAENAEGAEFGTDKVQECLCGKDPVPDILAAVQSFCGNLEAQDDRTLVVLERTK